MIEVTKVDNLDFMMRDDVLEQRVKRVMEKFVGTELVEETCDHLMDELLAEFGKDADAKVMVDTDTGEIEITVRNLIGVFMTFSSLTLFSEK